MTFRPFVRHAISLSALVLLSGLFLASCRTSAPSSPAPKAAAAEEHDEGPHLLEARERERYEVSRHGLQFGAPKHGFARAVTRMHAMQHEEAARRKTSNYRASSAANVASPALSGTWNLLGPFPMSEKANYTGNAVGANQPMTGRITSVAADTTGLIVAGAASGGLWVSTNDGASFASVFDNEPTQAIGAIALDTTTNPSTIYVGTGEGNNSIDSLYGVRHLQVHRFGAIPGSRLGPKHIRSRRVHLDGDRYHYHAGHRASLRARPADLAGAARTRESSKPMRPMQDYGFPPMAAPPGPNIRNQPSATAICSAAPARPAPPMTSRSIRLTRRTCMWRSTPTMSTTPTTAVRTFTSASSPGEISGKAARVWRSVPRCFPRSGRLILRGGAVYAMIGASDGAEYDNMFASFDAGADLELPAP